METTRSELPGQTRTEKLAWLGGYIDGEGTLGIYNGRLSVRITNTHLKTLVLIQEFLNYFGGSITLQSDNEIHKPVYVYSVYGTMAAQLAQDLIPFLNEKKKQACMLYCYKTMGPECRIHAEQFVKELKH